MKTIKKAQNGVTKKPAVKVVEKKTTITAKPKTVSQRLGDTTLRDVKNAGEDALQLVTLGGYGKAKKALGGEYKYKKIGEKKYGGKVTKAKNGTSLGMKSVKAGFDKNPGVTRADIIVAGKGKARKGAVVKKAKSGSKVKKAFLGSLLGGVGKNLLGSVTSNLGGMLGGGALGGGLGKMMGSLGKAKTQPALPSSSAMKRGGTVKKAQMGSFVSNEFAAKNRPFPNSAKPKSTSNTKLLDSSIKKGKAINAYQGKKGMVAKSGTSMKKCKYGCK